MLRLERKSLHVLKEILYRVYLLGLLVSTKT